VLLLELSSLFKSIAEMSNSSMSSGGFPEAAEATVKRRLAEGVNGM
jgi:hypothetical protein